MAVAGFWNKDNTIHQTIPLKNVRYVTCLKTESGIDRYFIKYLGARNRLELTKETYDTLVEAMDNEL